MGERCLRFIKSIFSSVICLFSGTSVASVVESFPTAFAAGLSEEQTHHRAHRDHGEQTETKTVSQQNPRLLLFDWAWAGRYRHRWLGRQAAVGETCGREAKMNIFGKTLSDYVRFERGFLILVLVVGIARLSLSLLGVPNNMTRFLSLTVLFLLGMLYYSVYVYSSGFGSYKQLLPVIALPVIIGNCIIITGIVIAILTAEDNIFSAPEFSPHKVDGKSWGHAASHVVVMIVLPLILWAVGSSIMFATKKLTGAREPRGGAAGGYTHGHK